LDKWEVETDFPPDAPGRRPEIQRRLPIKTNEPPEYFHRLGGLTRHVGCVYALQFQVATR